MQQVMPFGFWKTSVLGFSKGTESVENVCITMQGFTTGSEANESTCTWVGLEDPVAALLRNGNCRIWYSTTPRLKARNLTLDLLVQACIGRLKKLQTRVQKQWQRLELFQSRALPSSFPLTCPSHIPTGWHHPYPGWVISPSIYYPTVDHSYHTQNYVPLIF